MRRTARIKAGVVATAVLGITMASQVPATAAPVGVLASYQGRVIDLGKGWDGAQVCAEYAVGDVRCYSNDQAASGDFAISDVNDCKISWVCLWEDIGNQGRKLQWNVAGTKKLEVWGFRDKASSAALHRAQSGAQLTNYRTSVLPDQHVALRADAIYEDFRQFNFNDKADEIKVY